MAKTKSKSKVKKVIPLQSEKVLQKANEEMNRLSLGGVYLPEKDLKENTLVKSYKIKQKKYEQFFAICYNSGYSLNLIINQLIEVFIKENKSKIKPIGKRLTPAEKTSQEI